jgi:hypothetical protein
MIAPQAVTSHTFLFGRLLLYACNRQHCYCSLHINMGPNSTTHTATACMSVYRVFTRYIDYSYPAKVTHTGDLGANSASQNQPRNKKHRTRTTALVLVMLAPLVCLAGVMYKRFHSIASSSSSSISGSGSSSSKRRPLSHLDYELTRTDSSLH